MVLKFSKVQTNLISLNCLKLGGKKLIAYGIYTAVWDQMREYLDSTLDALVKDYSGLAETIDNDPNNWEENFFYFLLLIFSTNKRKRSKCFVEIPPF